jgi:hypothetical protein
LSFPSENIASYIIKTEKEVEEQKKKLKEKQENKNLQNEKGK